MFLVLTLALLPLGLIALFASLQAIRTADVEREALLRVAATQSARKLSAEMLSDQAALRLTVNTLASGRADANLCNRADAFLRSRGGDHVRFVIYARNGRRVCSSRGSTAADMVAKQRFTGPGAELLPEHGLMVTRTRSSDGSLVALTLYDRAYLDRVADPATALAGRHVVLAQGTRRLDVGGDTAALRGKSVQRVSARLDASDIFLTLIVRDPPVTVARTLSLFLPLLMWFAAAALGWFVVNQLLIKPLVLLRRAVAAYHPGEVIEPLRRIRTPAQEIADLGETFRAISEDVATHEAEMAEGLERQRKLTREVHHRVKNNLQIIASLINLHSRSAATPEAADAYSSIQRRVDALSVVHRNHYAELEDNRGVGIRALVSELSASLRATAPVSTSRLMIQVDSDNLHVSQDVAVPVAFLITELVELAMLSAPNPLVRISVRHAEDSGRAILAVSSPALRPSEAVHEHLEHRFGRVLTGLSRQLRAPLELNEIEGEYCIAIGVQD